MFTNLVSKITLASQLNAAQQLLKGKHLVNIINQSYVIMVVVSCILYK